MTFKKLFILGADQYPPKKPEILYKTKETNASYRAESMLNYTRKRLPKEK